jgi:hypothetical protein
VRGIAEQAASPTRLPLLQPAGNTSLAVSLYRAEISARSAEIEQLRAEKRQLALEAKRLKALVSLERTNASFARLDLSRAPPSQDVKVWRAPEQIGWPAVEPPRGREGLADTRLFPSPNGPVGVSASLLRAGAAGAGAGAERTIAHGGGGASPLRAAAQPGQSQLGSRPDPVLPEIGMAGPSGESPSADSRTTGLPDSRTPGLPDPPGPSGESPSAGELKTTLPAADGESAARRPADESDPDPDPNPNPKPADESDGDEYLDDDFDADVQGETDADGGAAAIGHRAVAAGLDDDAAWRARELQAESPVVERAVDAHLSRLADVY